MFPFQVDHEKFKLTHHIYKDRMHASKVIIFNYFDQFLLSCIYNQISYIIAPLRCVQLTTPPDTHPCKKKVVAVIILKIKLIVDIAFRFFAKHFGTAWGMEVLNAMVSINRMTCKLLAHKFLSSFKLCVGKVKLNNEIRFKSFQPTQFN